MPERWPPVYDADELAACIAHAAGHAGGAGLWEPPRRDLDPAICQGDVLQLHRGLPLLDEGLEATVLDPEFDHWLVIGNTCDFAREPRDTPWTQLVPVHEFGDLSETEPGLLADLVGYRLSRRFYMPPWPGATARLRFADLLTPVAALKADVPRCARVVARMNFSGWILLHSCLVRFLCRDDGRFD